MTNSYTLANNFLVETDLLLDLQSLNTLEQDLLKLQERLFLLANNLDYKQLLDEFKQLDNKFQQLNPNPGTDQLRITYLGDLDLSAVINSLASSLGLAKPLTNALLVSNPSIRIEGLANDRKIEIAVSQLPIDGLIALFSNLAGGVLPDEVLNALKSVSDKLDKLEFTLLEDRLAIRYQDSLNFSISFDDLIGGAPSFVHNAISAITKTIFDSKSSTSLDLTIKNPEISVATGPEIELSGGFKVGKISVNYDKQKDISLSYELPNELDFSKLAADIPVLSEFKLSDPEIIISSAAEQINDPTLGAVTLVEGFNFIGNIDFENAKDQFSKFLYEKLGIKKLGVLVSLGSNGASLAAVVPLDATLLSLKNLQALLKNIQLFLVIDDSGEPTFGLKGSLELSGYDPFQSNEPTLLLSGNVNLELESVTAGFALQAGSQPWVNPFGIPDTEIRNLALQVGATYQPPFVDNVGFLGDFIFGNYDLKAAFSVDINDPDNIALFLKTNQPLPLVDLLTGPVGSFVLKQVGDEISIIDKTLDLLDTVLDVNVSGLDVNNDGEVEPLIQFVPFKTDIAGIPVEEGFGINAQVDAYGVKGKLALNADKDLSEITGSLAIPKIDLGGLGVIAIQGKNDSELNLDVRLDANPLSLPTISGDASIKLFGSELLGAEFKIGSNDVKIKGTRTIPGVLTLAADFSASNITNSNLNFNGSGNLSVFGNPIANATISGDRNRFSATGKLNLLGIPGVLQGSANATVSLGTTPNDFALSGSGNLSIFGNSIANATFSGNRNNLTAKGSLGLNFANILKGNVDATVGINNNSNFNLSGTSNLSILGKNFGGVSVSGDKNNLSFKSSNLSVTLGSNSFRLRDSLNVSVGGFKFLGKKVPSLGFKSSIDLNVKSNGSISGGVQLPAISVFGKNIGGSYIDLGGIDSYDKIFSKIENTIKSRAENVVQSVVDEASRAARAAVKAAEDAARAAAAEAARAAAAAAKAAAEVKAAADRAAAAAAAEVKAAADRARAAAAAKAKAAADKAKKEAKNLQDKGEKAFKKVFNGNIDDATVWLDTNGNGLFDSDEPNTKTNADGTYFLEIPDEIDTSSTLILAQGGIDTSTGLAVQTTFSVLPNGNSTPLTVLIQQLVNLGLTMDNALAQVRVVFGIASDIDLFSFDHIEETLNANLEAKAVLLAIANLGSTVIGVQDLLAGAGGSTVTQLDPLTNFVLSKAIYASIANLVAQGNVNLGDPVQLDLVIRQAAASAQQMLKDKGIAFSIDLNIIDRIASEAAQVIASATAKKQLLSEGVAGGFELLNLVTQAKNVFNGEEANALNQFGLGQITEAQVLALADTSTDALNAIRTVTLPPQLADLSNLFLVEGQQLTDIPITVYDFETSQDTLIITVLSDNPILLPKENVTLTPSGNANTRFLSIRPIVGQTGKATLTIVVTDGEGRTINQDITVAVEEDQAPLFFTIPIPLFVNRNSAEGTSILDMDANDGNQGTIDLSVNYALVAGNEDIDGDGEQPFIIDLNGEIFINDLDDLTAAITPKQFNLLVSANDGAKTTEMTVPIKLIAADNSIFPALADTAEDIPITFKVVDLLAGFSEVDENTLFVSNLFASNGTLADNNHGTYTFSPDANFNGVATLTYDVTDGEATLFGQTRSFNVKPVNDPPVADPDKTLTLLEDATPTPLNIAAPTDIDGDTLTILINTIPDSSKGTIRLSDGTAITAGQSLTLDQLTSLTFTPVANANGSAGSFSYTVSDGQGGSASQTVAITITPDGNGGSWGDPHIFTFDQFHYDFQATGDFILVRALDSDLQVQVRQTPWDKNLATTINTGLATLVDGNRLEFYVDRPLPLVNNQALSIQPGETLALGQGSISRTSITGYGMQGDLYTVTYPNGDVLYNKVFSGFLIDPTLDLANSRNVVGLLGNNNGNAADDLALSDGTILSTSPDLDTLYGAFANSWRVSEAQSFFSPTASTPPLSLSQSDLNLQNDLDRVIQQLVLGGNDNDILIGVTDAFNNPGKGEIDLFMGNKGADTFVLGDRNNCYYVGSGQQDYALIADLWAEDKVQLHGSASDYVLGAAPSNLANGTGIFLTSDPNELIGIIQGDGMTNLNLSNRSIFEYV
jgi:Cadherin-like domain/von Willebrand factor type D domain